MYNLAKNINDTIESNSEDVGLDSCSFYYQTSQCKDLIKQVFSFEGWTSPDIIKSSKSIDFDKLREIVIFELVQSANIVEDARDLSSKLPNQKGAIIIGKEDTISILRELKGMGFYYLLWPLNQVEMSEFLRNVYINLNQPSGVNKNRKAKRVAVVGTKGGIGNTMISCELSSKLAFQGINTIQVDHQYVNSNTDILLGLKDFQRQNADNLELQIKDMDDESASNYLYKVDENFRLLALGGSISAEILYSNSQLLVKQLSRQTNFIVEDFSSANDFMMAPADLSERIDVFVIVLEPTVSSVRNASQIIEKIEMHNLSGRFYIRILTFLNIHRPDSAFPLSKQEVELYLKRTVDVHLNYTAKCSTIILSGKRLHRLEKPSGAFNKLSQLIQGKQIKTKISPLDKLKELIKNE